MSIPDVLESTISGLITAGILSFLVFLSRRFRDWVFFSFQQFKLDVDSEMMPVTWSISVPEHLLSIKIVNVGERCLKQVSVSLGSKVHTIPELHVLDEFHDIQRSKLAIRLVSMELTTPESEKEPTEALATVEVRRRRAFFVL